MSSIHFTLGDDFGKRIMEIAQEKLLYKYDGEGAVSLLIESFPGMYRDLALQIIKGDCVIDVDEDGVNVNIRKREESDTHPQINFDKYFENLFKYYISNYNSDKQNFDNFFYNFKDRYFNRWDKHEIYSIPSIDELGDNIIEKDLSYEDIYEILFKGTDKQQELLNEYSIYSSKLDNSIKTIKTLYKIFEECKNIKRNIDFVKDNFDYQFEDYSLKQFEMRFNELMTLISMIENKCYMVSSVENDIDKFIETELKYEDESKQEIQPNDITEKFDASWISPEGDYYGMNGGIANFLHNKIADRLQEKFNFPIKGQNIDAYLMENGWVRIHSNQILFDGYLMEPYIHLTDKQIKIIEKYGQMHCRGIISCNYNNPIPAVRISMVEKPMLYKLFKIGI